MAIDQGTTSSRAIIYDEQARPLTQHHQEFHQHFPQPGWVEHDPEEIWQSVLTCCRQAIAKANIDTKQITGIGITNQRETTLIWNKQTGKPIHNAIVWQDRRTTDYCKALRQQYNQSQLQHKTGLLFDPYFSASKINWLLNNIAGAKQAAESGELAFGTIDTYLLWRLTNGQVHATDATNASRTALFNLHKQAWDEELLTWFDIPHALLPDVYDCAAEFGVTHKSWFGAEIPILAIAGDQQAALIGQTCFSSGMIKSTYGTGSFVVVNTGNEFVLSHNRLLSTVGYRLNGKVTYALEGSIFNAGTVVNWLHDNMQLIDNAHETEDIAASLDDNHGVYFVPAFTGLGAPYWAPNIRGAIFGITRNTQREHIVRAAIESIAYQTRDLLTAIRTDTNLSLKELRVDGGMVANNWLLQFLADVTAVPVLRASILETTALGVAYLAGMQAGLFSLDTVSQLWHANRSFTPQPNLPVDSWYADWKNAISSLTNTVQI